MRDPGPVGLGGAAHPTSSLPRPVRRIFSRIFLPGVTIPGYLTRQSPLSLTLYAVFASGARSNRTSRTFRSRCDERPDLRETSGPGYRSNRLAPDRRAVLDSFLGRMQPPRAIDAGARGELGGLAARCPDRRAGLGRGPTSHRRRTNPVRPSPPGSLQRAFLLGPGTAPHLDHVLRERAGRVVGIAGPARTGSSVSLAILARPQCRVLLLQPGLLDLPSPPHLPHLRGVSSAPDPDEVRAAALPVPATPRSGSAE